MFGARKSRTANVLRQIGYAPLKISNFLVVIGNQPAAANMAGNLAGAEQVIRILRTQPHRSGDNTALVQIVEIVHSIARRITVECASRPFSVHQATAGRIQEAAETV